MTLISRLQLSVSRLNVALFVFAFLLTGSVARTQSSPETPLSSEIDLQHAISVTSELVILPVNVTNARGNFVSGLNESNFHVYEEKRLQKLSLFQQEDTPVSVGLIVDHSSSMGPKMANVIAAISAFANSGNPEDEMFVVDFSDRVTVEPLGGKLFTNDPVELGKAVETVSAHGRTALYDAVAAGLIHIQRSHLQRKALIIVSDGGDNASNYKYSEILELARQSQVTIYSIVLVDESTKEQRPKVLQQLSKDTGGVALFPESWRSVTDSSAQIAHDLREQYVLGYVPEKRTSGSLFRKIQVQVTVPEKSKLHVRTRPGYSLASDRAGLTGIAEDPALTSVGGATKETSKGFR